MPVRLDLRNTVLRRRSSQPVPESLADVEAVEMRAAARQRMDGPIRQPAGKGRDNPVRAPDGSHPALSGHVPYQLMREAVRTVRRRAQKEWEQAHGAQADTTDMPLTPIRVPVPE
jgi:hypothetical protein